MLWKMYLCKWKYLHVEYLIQIKLISNQMTLVNMTATYKFKMQTIHCMLQCLKPQVPAKNITNVTQINWTLNGVRCNQSPIWLSQWYTILLYMWYSKRIVIFLHYYVPVQHVLYLYQPTEAEWRTYVSVNYVIIRSNNGSSHIWHQAIVWTKIGLLAIGPFMGIFQWIINRNTFSWMKRIFHFKNMVCNLSAILFSTRYVGIKWFTSMLSMSRLSPPSGLLSSCILSEKVAHVFVQRYTGADYMQSEASDERVLSLW